MARISVWFVRAALLHFAVGTSAGAWRLAVRGGLLPPSPIPLRPLHVEGLLVGWLTQFALGTALWIFPFSRSVSSDRRLWSAGLLLNVGIAAAVVGQSVGRPSLFLAGRGAELIAGALLAWGLWPRLRPLPQRRH